jgi:DNA-binding LacI/PurR family transcriptional regulator
MTQASQELPRKRVAIVSSFFRLGQWRGIMRYGQEAGWICQRHDRDSLDRLSHFKPDGLLFQVDEYDDSLLDYVRQQKIPRVGLRALLGQEEQTPLVLPNLAKFGRRIAEHFAANNIRRLCYLGPASDEAANAGCTHKRGMQEVANEKGLKLSCVHPDLPQTWKSLGLPYRRRSRTDWDRFWRMGPAMIQSLLQHKEPVGVFSAFVEPAMELIEMIDELGAQIPGQISLAAQTEDALTGLVTKVPLTCLVPDYEFQGFEAARVLGRILQGEKLPNNHREFIDDCELFLRGSSNKIVTPDPLVAEMLKHIEDNVLRFDFTPSALAATFGYSLRFVQIRFREALQRGVAEIIREQRTNHAAELIKHTKLTFQEIVSECGFSDHHQLERAVRKFYAVNPTTLRKNASENS